MIRIVTDSSANFPADLAAKHHIEIVPLSVHIGDRSYREGGEELTQERFFQLLPNADPLPTTSQPTPAEFEEVFRRLHAGGAEIISVDISSKLSGTYNSAHNARLALEEAPISVVDSKSVSAGISLLVLAAARMAEAGLQRTEIVKRLEGLADEVLLVLTLNTLEYLKKGGRIGGASAFLGGLLRVKPIIYLKDGALEPGERARSRSKALKQLVQMQWDRFGDRPVWLGTAQAQADDVAELEQMARDRLNVQEVVRSDIGPVVATHTGPGTVGLAVIPAPQLD